MRAARRTTYPSSSCPPATPCTFLPCSATAFGLSTSEARRLIAQGAVKIADVPVSELDLPRAALEGALVQAGKRRFVRFAD